MFTALCSITAMAQVPNYVPTSGLAAWYSFSGNANDLSGNNNNGTVIAATLTNDRFANINSAFNFNGTSDHISLNNTIGNFGQSDFSVSVWRKNTNAINDGCTIGKRNTYGWGNFWEFDFYYQINQTDASDFFAYQSGEPAGSWTHVVIVRASNHIKTYSNSVLVHDTVTPIIHNVINTATTEIGARRDGTNLYQFYNGSIDDLGLWTRALTPCEINQLYQSAVIPTPTASITPQSSTTICSGGFVNLDATAGTGYTYQWYNNSGAIGGATNATYTANQTGNYTVVVNNSGCTATSTPVTVTVNTAPSAAVNVSGATTFCSGNSVTLTAQGTGTYLWSNGATTNAITVTQTGNYSVTVTANGCSATSGITAITVNQTPTASITPAGATTFCAGGFVTLTASGGGTYQWNTGASSPSINATQSNTYSVIVTANGCSATASQVVTANPNPTVTLSPLGNFTNLNASAVTLNGNPAGGTYTGAGVTGSVFTPLTAGLGSSTINYNYTNGFGCSGAASQSTIVYDTLGQVCTSYDTITTYISVSDTLIINALLTGINPPNNHNTVKIYPNPSSDHLYIDNGNYTMMNGYTCTITNALSQQVFYSLINQQQFYIDLSTWTGNGLYFVTIRDAGNTIIEVKKIVIQ